MNVSDVATSWGSRVDSHRSSLGPRHASIRLEPHPHHLLVVLGFRRHRDLVAICRIDAAAAPAADVALVLARSHLGMPGAQRAHLRREFDRGLATHAIAIDDTYVDRAGWNLDGNRGGGDALGCAPGGFGGMGSSGRRVRSTAGTSERCTSGAGVVHAARAIKAAIAHRDTCRWKPGRITAADAAI